MAGLPYWSTNVEMEVASWLPLGIDYDPVSVNAHHSLRLGHVAALSMGLGSEFFCLSSLMSGTVGNLFRDSMFLPGMRNRVGLGFTMIFGYSEPMEDFLADHLDGREDVEAGVSYCRLGDRSVPLDTFKVIVLVSGDPFFSEDRFLEELEKGLMEKAPVRENVSYFAERFGYRRCSIPYETDDPVGLEISKLLYEMEFRETRRAVGPSPEVPFPPFVGLMLSL
ncbi:MAG TPA: hypothetical protein DIC53_06750 [Synergistaceae bacterium]|nr:hypothetical protein [Synergistaceae bacterium]